MLYSNLSPPLLLSDIISLLCISPVSPSLPPSPLFDGWEGRGESERRSVGIITVWRTRMDLYTISVVGCCANLPSTNGTAVHCHSTSWYQSKAINQQNLSLWWLVRGTSPQHSFIWAIHLGTKMTNKRNSQTFQMKTGMGRQQGVQQCSNSKIKPESAY